jgi:hypothetical protein
MAAFLIFIFKKGRQKNARACSAAGLGGSV